MTEKRLYPSDDLSAAFAVRGRVFMDEQGFSYDIDEHDANAWHLILCDNNTPIAAGRIIADSAGKCHMGRICVLKKYRGGMGKVLMDALIAFAKDLHYGDEISLGAQTRVVGFYEKCGFTVCGEEYDDEGVPHTPMILINK